VLGVAESTLHAWRLKHEEFVEALRRTKDEANAIVEASLYKRPNGFHYETERVTHGREYALPDVGAQRLWLQNRMPEVYREQKEVKHALGMDEAFLLFLDKMDARAKLERARNAGLIEHRPELVAVNCPIEALETRAVEAEEQRPEEQV
jgi:hypothetical protein